MALATSLRLLLSDMVSVIKRSSKRRIEVSLSPYEQKRYRYCQRRFG